MLSTSKEKNKARGMIKMRATRVKVTVTLAPEIVAALDKKAKEDDCGSRSAALEAVLRES